ncbi:SapC family protein [Nitrospirillum viridazoti]|uniref:SapC family protein n=2 Tax=Nitrospirillum TaxID=1543705 RepID=A0A248JNQ7_9PROT|nr:SapC family protein [Nitrospirillum amazonense]ASG20120.1 SapC family protein [Nitrospirillum amazonense CBAmc]TWB36174.1 SapC protein [Nitrospirillum amazonense]TWB50014.1 SapC protein [Nitrospirillum amazonense]
MTDAAAANSEAGQMPPFYREPVPVDISRHGDWKLKQQRTFSYAANANAIPIVGEEFISLNGHYPIVFTLGNNPAAVVLTGVRPDENLFVDGEGNWRKNTPIPAYVRRYPFLMMETPDRERLVLCLEEDANLVGPDGDVPLFEGDKAGAAGNDALNFCATFNQSAVATSAFCKELHDRGLLVEQRLDLTLSHDNSRMTLTGFTIIDEKKFNELPDDVFLDWRKRGYLGLVYSHFISLSRWSILAELASERVLAKKA